jgi:hypothetical protein
VGRGMRRLCAGLVGGVLVTAAVQIGSTTDAIAQASVAGAAHHSGHGSPQTSGHGSPQGSAPGLPQSTGRGSSHRREHNTLSVSGQAACQSDGTYSVTWYVTNGGSQSRTVSVSGHRPRSASVSPSSQTIGGGSSGSFTQSGVSGNRTSASLSLRASQGRDGQASGSVSTDGRCRAKHSPGQPVPTNGSCASTAAMNPSVRIPSDPDVTYALDGSPVAAGDVPVSDGTHQVTASSSEFALDRSAFTFTVHAAQNCTSAATLGSPHVTAPACVTGGGQASDFSTSLPSTSGIVYSAAPAVRTASGWAVTVSAAATHGFRLGQVASGGWRLIGATRATMTVAIPSPLSCVQAAAPTFTAATCIDDNLSGPSVTLAATPGVAYFADGQQLTAGTYPVADGATVNITSQALAGYLMTGSKSFTHAFPSTPVCAGVKVDPRSGVTLGASVGLRGLTLGATVHASLADGASARILSSAPCGSNCLGPIIPPSAAFHDDHCVTSSGQRSGASFTIPSVTGAIYWVNGSVVGAGTYPAVDGMTVTIVTTPRTGYSLSGITQWTHTFPDAPSCSGVSAKQKTASTTSSGGSNSSHRQDSAAPNNTATSSTAFSGTPVAQLTLTGTALLLMGGAACFAGAAVRRRWLPVA